MGKHLPIILLAIAGFVVILTIVGFFAVRRSFTTGDTLKYGDTIFLKVRDRIE